MARETVVEKIQMLHTAETAIAQGAIGNLSGLSMATIQIHANPDPGTTFTIDFKARSVPTGTAANPEAPFTHKAVTLIKEDDNTVVSQAVATGNYFYQHAFGKAEIIADLSSVAGGQVWVVMNAST